MIADASIAMATLILAILFAFGVQAIGFVFLIMFIRAMGTAFHRPAMMALTTLIISKRHCSRIAGFNNALRGYCNCRPLLLEISPIQSILAIDIGTAVFTITPLLFIGIPQPKRSQTLQTMENKPSVFDDLREGLRFIWHWLAPFSKKRDILIFEKALSCNRLLLAGNCIVQAKKFCRIVLIWISTAYYFIHNLFLGEFAVV
ncbi:MAG: MFS transporter [Chloroflexi bacterium]|nr:MFS transporter [Chloroflexota bacterium]